MSLIVVVFVVVVVPIVVIVVDVVGNIHNSVYWWQNKSCETKLLCCSLQRQNAENLKQIFPEKEYRGLSPNFHIHVSVSELYIPTMGLPFLLEEILGPILGIYKSLTDTWMWKLVGAEAAQFPEKE